MALAQSRRNWRSSCHGSRVFSRVRGTVKWKEFGGEERQKRFSREGGCD